MSPAPLLDSVAPDRRQRSMAQQLAQTVQFRLCRDPALLRNTMRAPVSSSGSISTASRRWQLGACPHHSPASPGYAAAGDT